MPATAPRRAAVDMLTKQLASEFGQFGVTVNALGPNITATPMMTAIFEKRAADAGISVEEYLVQQGQTNPMRKMGMPEDIVGTAIFLSAPASDFHDGQHPVPRRRPHGHRLNTLQQKSASQPRCALCLSTAHASQSFRRARRKRIEICRFRGHEPRKWHFAWWPRQSGRHESLLFLEPFDLKTVTFLRSVTRPQKSR